MLIVGLGNPGEEYKDTFHNCGFNTVDALADKLGKKIDKIECSALTAVKSIRGENIILAKPLTYMNLSGQAVASLLKKYNQTLDDLIVIYDDVDIDRFSVRVRQKGSAGTHNGMRNVLSCVNSQDFKRIRIGVGRNEYDLKDYVLSKPSADDKKTFSQVFNAVADLLIQYINDRDTDRLVREGNVINYGAK